MRRSYYCILVTALSLLGFQQGLSQSNAQNCSLPDFDFPCPIGVKVKEHDKSRQLFIGDVNANEEEFFLFVFDKKLSKDVNRTIRDEFVRKLFPTFKRLFNWKDLDFMIPSLSSKFESSKKYVTGFDGRNIVNYAYREINLTGRSVVVGSIWKDNEVSGAEAKEFFEEITGGTEFGCYTIVDVVRAMTKEKSFSPSDDKHPCVTSIVTSSMSSAENND